MSPILLLIYATVLAIIAGAGFVVLGMARQRGGVARSLQMVLFSFALPRYAPAGPGAQQKNDRDLIAVMEQLYSSVANLHAKGWNKFIHGDPHIALEMSVHHVGEQIHFYTAVPAAFADNFERQVNGLFPAAQVARSTDYSIFNPSGASAGAYLQLKSDAILPLRTYMQLESDPLGPLVSALGRLQKEGEGASIQLTVRPSSNTRLRKFAMETARFMQAGSPFSKAVKLAKNPPKKTDKEKPPGTEEVPKVATEFESQIIKSLQAKASRPLFDCNIRILTSGGDDVRAGQILDDVIGAFSQFSGPELNAFSAKKVKGRDLERLVFEYAFRLFNHGQSMPLSGEEVTSVYHFPVSSAVLPRVKFANFKTAEPPAGLPEDGVAMGVNVFQGRETWLRVQTEERLRHTYIIGQTGTGKSVTLKSMIVQDIEAGEGITILDPHGEFAEWALERVPRERIDDVIYFNPADTDYAMGLNMFEYDTTKPTEKTLIIDELFEIMNKLYDLKESGGPQFEQYFKNAIFLLLDNYDRQIPTLSDLSRLFIDEAYREDLLAHESNQIVRQFWEGAKQRTGEQSIPNFTAYITSKVDAFTSNDFLRPIVNQPVSAINFTDVIENRKILIVNLSKGRIGDLNADLLGMVIVGKLRRAALARDTTRRDIPPHFAFLDEFQNVTTQSISVILSEARKYRLGLIMAHQFIKQLDEGIRNAVFGNVGNTIVFRISAEDAEDTRVKTKFEPYITPYDISNIDNNNAYIAMLLPGGKVARPTSMRTLLKEFVIDKQGDPKLKEAIVEICRLKYARPRGEVEAEIQDRFTRLASMR